MHHVRFITQLVEVLYLHCRGQKVHGNRMHSSHEALQTLSVCVLLALYIHVPTRGLFSPWDMLARWIRKNLLQMFITHTLESTT